MGIIELSEFSGEAGADAGWKERSPRENPSAMLRASMRDFLTV